MTDMFICFTCKHESEKIEIVGLGNFVPFVCDSCGVVYMAIASSVRGVDYHPMDYNDFIKFFETIDQSSHVNVTIDEIRDYYLKVVNVSLRKHKIAKLQRRIVDKK